MRKIGYCYKMAGYNDLRELEYGVIVGARELWLGKEFVRTGPTMTEEKRSM
jgi:hypothetical protein